MSYMCLVGPNAGKTKKLGQYQFVNGRFYVPEDRMHLTGKALMTTFQCVEEHKFEAAQAQYLKDQSSSGNVTATVSAPIAVNGLSENQVFELLNSPQAEAMILKAIEARENGKRNLSENEHKESQTSVQGDLQPAGQGTETKTSDTSQRNAETTSGTTGKTADTGNGESLTPPIDSKLVEVLRSLSPEDASLWTNAGKPNLSAVGQRLEGNVTRQMIEAAIPGFNREAARKEL